MPVTVGLNVPVSVGRTEFVAVGVTVGCWVWVNVGVGVAVAGGGSVFVGVSVTVGRRVPVFVGVSVGVDEGRSVFVGVKLIVGLAVGCGVPVAVGVGVLSDWASPSAFAWASGSLSVAGFRWELRSRSSSGSARSYWSGCVSALDSASAIG